ncbi:heme ABC transporter ATP-binding protein [Chelatococcus sp. SYSU_G07232]|uniref:Heme ABC transporter ATP-binding protein n=1 Tax=Chelatococcus albus TaxID=3047466 RepID=A0ABT7AJQ4_9HYPH|nr:heme ABC transporter ATP-binding protein [Chelatococcus sp. SYSU_G07232]MDJ1159599.1 heme ABC transporter ATP-binding protein [Chelatococcus sp. SYSU_G07232]
MTRLLEARDLGFAISGRTLVAEARLTIAAGELVVVIGPNGAGKSTLLRLLDGELRPTTGSITYGGTAIGTLPAWRLACKRAVLPQASRLSFPFTVFEVARLGLDGIGRALPGARRDLIAWSALETADVAHLAGRAYQTLSGGEQQRAQFARVLCQLEAGRTVEAEQVLFLDEPTASLDLKHQIGLLEAARALCDTGIGVLAILHDLNIAAAYAHKLVVMRQGRVVASGPPAAVLTDALVREVFEVPLSVGTLPPPEVPFLLPQAGRRGAQPAA